MITKAKSLLSSPLMPINFKYCIHLLPCQTNLYVEYAFRYVEHVNTVEQWIGGDCDSRYRLWWILTVTDEGAEDTFRLELASEQKLGRRCDMTVAAWNFPYLLNASRPDWRIIYYLPKTYSVWTAVVYPLIIRYLIAAAHYDNRENAVARNDIRCFQSSLRGGNACVFSYTTLRANWPRIDFR